MIYLLFKTIHIGSVIVWVGGMLLLAFATSVASQPDEGSVAKAAVRWDRSVTAPAMALAWICGLTIALQGKWFASAWLIAKLVLVILLSALHGYQGGSLRRLANGGGQAAPSLRYAAWATLACMLTIVALVVFKP